LRYKTTNTKGPGYSPKLHDYKSEMRIKSYIYITGYQKTHQLRNGIAGNYKIDFDDIWQKYSKDSVTEFACFSFHVGLLLFVFQTGH